MGLFDSIMGRSKPKAANLDSLFAVPSAAITLQTSLGFLPTGSGSVCYRAAAGAGFAGAQSDIVSLLSSVPDAPVVRTSSDQYGFTWLEVNRPAGVDDGFGGVPDTGALCTDLHAVNTTLEAEGFGPSLLCSLIPFADASGRRFGLVYLYKQGTFYPFAPTATGQGRDNLLEIQIRDTVAGELPIEKDLQRWLALWGAPGL